MSVFEIRLDISKHLLEKRNHVLASVFGEGIDKRSNNKFMRRTFNCEF